MVQEFHVTRCVTCENFQVQQVKKSTTKWSCKVCGEKQSLLKEYGRGSAPDCRRHVQKLNAMRGALVEEQERTACSLWEQEQEPDDNTEHESTEAQIQTSRWSKYLGTPKEVDIEQEPEDDMVLMDRQNCLNSRMTCRKRKRETPSEQAFQPVKQLTSTRTTGFNRSRTIGITHSLFKSSQTSNSLVQSSQTSLKENQT